MATETINNIREMLESELGMKVTEDAVKKVLNSSTGESGKFYETESGKWTRAL
jgi:hypothetical protein